MIQHFRERRHYHPYMPHIFFGLELVIYIELAYVLYYVLYYVLEEGKFTYLVILLVFSYQLLKSIKRFIYVKNRYKSVQSYKKFQKKAQEKMLKRM